MVWRRRAPGDDDPAAPPAPRRMRLSCALHSFVPAQTITVRITGAGEQTLRFDVSDGPGESLCRSGPFVPTGDEVRAVFTGSGAPRRVSATDSRELSFSVSSATLEPAGD